MLMLIVLVGVALFADLRRHSAEELTDMAGTDEFPGMTQDALRPNVRDVVQDNHRGTVPRPLSVRRSGQDVRKHS
jgi:hypothetical protein